MRKSPSHGLIMDIIICRSPFWEGREQATDEHAWVQEIRLRRAGWTTRFRFLGSRSGPPGPVSEAGERRSTCMEKMVLCHGYSTRPGTESPG